MLNVPFSQHQNFGLLYESSLLWTSKQEETGHYSKSISQIWDETFGMKKKKEKSTHQTGRGFLKGLF